jgi:hypothetical protein
MKRERSDPVGTAPAKTIVLTVVPKVTIAFPTVVPFGTPLRA